MKRHSLKFNLITSITALSMIALVSCNDIAPMKTTEQEIVESLKTIASIDLGKVGMVEFIETEPGNLVTTGLFASIETMAPYKDLNPVELYERMSGKKAPVELVDAYQRALDAAKEPTNVVPPPDLDVNEAIQGNDKADKVAKPYMSSWEFETEYCGNLTSYDFSICLTNRTGDNWYTRNCSLIINYISPYRGTVRFQAEYWTGSAYFTHYDRQVEQDYTLFYSISGAKRYRRMKIIEASGDGYHHVHKGDFMSSWEFEETEYWEWR
jgi:hypothetical protein